MTVEDLDTALIALVMGEARAFGSRWPPGLYERAAWHRVDLLVAASALANGSAGEYESVFRHNLRHAAAADLATTARVARVTASLSAAGVDHVLLKGAAIGPLLYAEPHLRPRLDTDVLIRTEDRETAERILERERFNASPEALGEIGTGQSHWIAADEPFLAIDLHWRLFNAQRFATVLGFDDIRRASIPAPAMPASLVPSLEHQFLIASLHRVAHHYDAPRLIWIYDLFLLARALGEDRVDRVLEDAENRGVGEFVARSLARTVDTFGLPLSERSRSTLSRLGAGSQPSVFLDGSPRLVDLLRDDLAAQKGWRARLRLVGEHLFPPAEYMRIRYAGCPRFLLPLAYLHRIGLGAPRWFRRSTGRR